MWSHPKCITFIDKNISSKNHWCSWWMSKFKPIFKTFMWAWVTVLSTRHMVQNVWVCVHSGSLSQLQRSTMIFQHIERCMYVSANNFSSQKITSQLCKVHTDCQSFFTFITGLAKAFYQWLKSLLLGKLFIAKIFIYTVHTRTGMTINFNDWTKNEWTSKYPLVSKTAQ